MIIVICEHCLFKIIIKEISNCTIDFLFLMFFFCNYFKFCEDPFLSSLPGLQSNLVL